jgi:hypothetical protein
MEKKTISKGHIKVIEGVTGMITVWDTETGTTLTLSLQDSRDLVDALVELHNPERSK